MNKLLAIDTSSLNCSVGLSSNGKMLSRTSAAERRAAQDVLPMISELLATSQSSISDLDAIAVMAGPGSFTGLRIGIGVAQGLSLAHSIPVIALSTLAVTAMATIRNSEVEQVLVSLKAREDEIYFGAYLISTKAGVKLLGKEQVCAPQLVQLQLDGASVAEEWHGSGDGWVYREQIESGIGFPVQDLTMQPAVDIADLIALAKLRFTLGESVLAEQLTPNYIKEKMDYSQPPSR
jgi:tRNA threonylcarbamoyladenosine biosynthesis protein TsaB